MRRLLLTGLLLAVNMSSGWAAATFEASWKLANCHDVTDTAICTAQEVTDSLDFREQVQIAVARVAKQVQGEAVGTFTSDQWDKRASLAQNIMSVHILDDAAGNQTAHPGVDLWLDVFANGVAEVATATTTSTDADIEFLVTQMWDDAAGVSGNDLQ